MNHDQDNEHAPFTAADIVFTYTTRDMIEDGGAVEPFPDRFPGWVFTIGVHSAIERAIEGTDRTYAQAALPLLMDAQMIVSRRPDHLHTEGLEGNVTGEAVWIGQNEIGGYTLMLPSEH